MQSHLLSAHTHMTQSRAAYEDLCGFAAQSYLCGRPPLTASKCQGVAAGAPQGGRPSIKKFIRIGVDLGKNCFQLHALESEDGRAKTRRLSRQAMGMFFPESNLALSAWRPALHPIIGRANSLRWVTRCGRSRRSTSSLMSNAARTTRPTRRQSARPWHVLACGSFQARARITKPP